jgi:hypothetical protein
VGSDPIFRIELGVRLRVPDVVAITARRTLWRRMGYEGVLAELGREEYWSIWFELGGIDEAQEIGRYLAEKSNIFVNPNKHRYRINIGEGGWDPSIPISQLDFPLVEKGIGKGSGDLHQVAILVGYWEDGTAELVANTLRKRLGYGDKVKAILRASLWTALIRASSPEEAIGIAEKITLLKDKEEGLLCNPHSQWYKLLSLGSRITGAHKGREVSGCSARISWPG